MRCPRCEGFTVREDLVGMNEWFLPGFSGWRRVNCGAIGDFVIQANQRRVAHSLLVRRATVMLENEDIALRPSRPRRSSSTADAHMPARLWKAGYRAGGNAHRVRENHRGRSV